MLQPLVLASGSEIRARLLLNADVPFAVVPPRIDEVLAKDALVARKTPPKGIALALAKMKAQSVSDGAPDALVIGCDQVLECSGALLSKPQTPAEAMKQLTQLSGNQHQLITGAVVYRGADLLWETTTAVRLDMRGLSQDYIEDYVRRNWESIRWAVGCYKLEEEGVRLFQKIEGDYFHVLGMPLVELLNFLVDRGVVKV